MSLAQNLARLASRAASDGTVKFTDLTNIPTTISGFGITDAQPLDGDLTSIAGLTGTSGFLKKTAANTWSLDTSTYLTGNQSISVTGDATGSGTTSIAVTLINSGVTAGTYTKVTVDAKGRVTSGAILASADLPTYTGTITSSQVTTALGFTPYNATNPNGYITSSSLSSFLPLSGGTMTGTLAFSDWTNSQFGTMLDAPIYNNSAVGPSQNWYELNVMLSGIPNGALYAQDNGTGAAKFLKSVLAGSTYGAPLVVGAGTTGQTIVSAGHTGVAAWGTLGVAGGGTGQVSYTIGNLLYANSTTTLAKVAPGSFGSVFYQSINTGDPMPAWSNVGTAGQAFISGGGAAVPSFGTLGVVGGGTGATTLTGLVKGNGTSAFTAAVAGTDYVAPSTLSSYLLLSGGVLTGGLREAKVAVSASDIDLSTGNFFTKTISGATTFTVSNVPATGTAASFVLDLTNGGSAAITWWTGMKWAGGTAPTLTSAGRDSLGFFTHDGGTTWTGLVLGKDIK